MLQAQIEPHFLFNTLANVKRLYQIDPAAGNDMLGAFNFDKTKPTPRLFLRQRTCPAG